MFFLIRQILQRKQWLMLNSSPPQKDNIFSFILLNTSAKAKEKRQKISPGHNIEACSVGKMMLNVSWWLPDVLSFAKVFFSKLSSCPIHVKQRREASVLLFLVCLYMCLPANPNILIDKLSQLFLLKPGGLVGVNVQWSKSYIIEICSFCWEVECEKKLMRLVLCRSVSGFYSSLIFLFFLIA